MVITMVGGTGCSTARTVLAIDPPVTSTRPIRNPFGEYYASAKGEPGQNIVLRTKKGDRSIEVELPGSDQGMSDFVIPMSPGFKDSGRAPASEGEPRVEGGVGEEYKDRAPTTSDREIAAAMPKGPQELHKNRQELETDLGLVQSDDGVPERDKSYLAGLDNVKRLYRTGRYEAALIEVDSLTRIYQTDPKLYQMRGTLLDRLGQPELAIKSWSQALRFDPQNQSLRRFIERRQVQRSVASP